MYSYRFKNTGGADTHPAGDEQPKSHRIHTGTVGSPARCLFTDCALHGSVSTGPVVVRLAGGTFELAGMANERERERERVCVISERCVRVEGGSSVHDDAQARRRADDAQARFIDRR